MATLSRPLDKPFRLIAEGRLSEVQQRLRGRLNRHFHEQTLAYGLRRDITVPWEAPKAKIPIEVRKVSASDLPVLFPDDQSHLPPEERQELAWRRAHMEANVPTCYVAVDQRNGTPCYFQWLMGPEQNDFIRSLGRFPVLQDGEALLENAYTPVAYRGFGIMAAAMALIAERGAALNARYVYTFVGLDNVPSLKGCAKAGFSPALVRRCTTWGCGLYDTVAFEPLPEMPASGG